MKLSCLAAAAAVCAVLGGFAAPSAVAQSGLPSGRTEYRTLSDYEADMLALAREHPNLVRPLTLPHATVEGRAVKGIEITRDVSRGDGKPVLLITGMHHGNEWASGEATMEFGFDLVENPRRDSDIARMLGRVRVVLVPVVNVDGFVRNTRRTARNVDMNRNYGFGWGESPPFQGSGPFSANHLSSSMTVTSADGTFNWSVNPSVRPVPPYQADGVHGDHPGFIQEAWTLTCARSDGTVLETVSVRVDLGGREAVDLERCRKGL